MVSITWEPVINTDFWAPCPLSLDGVWKPGMLTCPTGEANLHKDLGTSSQCFPTLAASQLQIPTLPPQVKFCFAWSGGGAQELVILKVILMLSQSSPLHMSNSRAASSHTKATE